MLTKVVSSLPLPTFVVDDRHRVIAWNAAIEALTGILKGDIIGTDDQWRVFYPEKRPTLADLVVDAAPPEVIDGYYRGKCVRSNLIEGAYEAMDLCHVIGTDGIWVRFVASPIRNDRGETVGAIETLEDVTERKKADIALQESERSYRELFEVALDAIWVHDPEGCILKANKAMERLTGFSCEELSQGGVQLFMTDEGLHLAHDFRAHLLNGEPVVQPYEQQLVRKDGTPVEVMFSTGLISRDGQVVAFQHIARDISEQKRMQRKVHHYLQQVTRAQEEERKRISRDLHDDTCQSLLLLIHGLDALLCQEKGEVSKSLGHKLSRLHNLAVDIHGRLRRYAGDLRPAILDDLGLIASLEWIADNMMSYEGIKTVTEFGTQACELPRESELVLFRIAQEAFNNVKKHAVASEVRIRLETETDRVTMTISDNGHGFGLPPTLADFGGEGKLGLMGMQERAQLVDGSFTIESQPGYGTAIRVEIPRSPATFSDVRD